ncbi:TVP38/TMEM64 family protein [Sinanaerobacter chloroacetimidivorans]|jgi:uncharacterized membrane protein YdjX (TVP38/TMEM64 family)|uniref:TVP38/TMEM64 family membrane protein n=1 Tax=Sinanaerobacter chloroacetimidivorans TaxID=2818044 RepID=A0A8J7VZR4_9FIRM|nr:VTT domain-containing protein [Sinanaerobacter chloroacetimidivorans]MBR0596610.1 TVP38/TMEM64 family protein [Sinanaerobacter chloroacetimidivorans]
MNQGNHYKRKKQIRTFVSIIKLLVLLGFIIGIPAYVYFNYPEFISHFNSLEEINSFLLQYKTASIFVYIGLQILQIIISVLPGQALQFAAGYAYSFWFGYLYSIIGVTFGTFITFYLARWLGKDAMHLFFGEERFTRFVHVLNSKRAYIVLFVIYLIPGIPKDLFVYAAGVSEIKMKPFLFLSLVGRTPALMGSVMMGSMFKNDSYTGLIILGIVAVVACIIGLLQRNRFLRWADKTYQKMVK